MTRPRTAMRKIREVLRLYFGEGLSVRLVGAAIGVPYLRAPRLLGDLALARADGRLPRVLAAWARVDVLVVDDFALRPLLPEQTADPLEVIEDRAGRRSTIIASQLPVRLWHEALAEPSTTDYR